MKNLKDLRKAAGITGEEAARALRISTPTWWNWEHGRTLPDANKIVPLADLFNISADELLRGE